MLSVYNLFSGSNSLNLEASKVSWTQPRPAAPATPRIEEPLDAGPKHEVEVALCLLQRLLRGRAVQNRMFLGKEVRYFINKISLRESPALTHFEYALS